MNIIELLNNVPESLDEIKTRLFANRVIKHFDGIKYPCWVTKAGTNNARRFRIDGKSYQKSRISAAIFLGFDLDDPRFICHACDHGGCFNPRHLFPGTQKENINDAINKGRFSSPIQKIKNVILDFDSKRLNQKEVLHKIRLIVGI